MRKERKGLTCDTEWGNEKQINSTGKVKVSKKEIFEFDVNNKTINYINDKRKHPHID